MIPVVELIRVSSEAQAAEDRQGIPAQRTANRQTCARLGLRVVETVEIVESGATVARSEDMARVLAIVESGRAKGIVLAAYDRLFRPDRWTDFAILQVIAEAGAHIYVPAGAIDLQTEPGFVQASVNNLMAGLERRRIRERTLRGRDELRRAGKLASAKAPFGMAYDRVHGWSYTEDIDVVKELFALYLSGEERNLHALGKRFGKPWNTVAQILRRPTYAGWLVFEPFGQREKRVGIHWPPLFPESPDSAIRVQTGLDPAVPVDAFLEVQRILQQRKERASLARKGTDAFLYRGMLSCACAAPLYGKVQRRGYGYYVCRSLRSGSSCGASAMRSTRLEVALDRIMGERLADEGLLVAAIEAHNRAAEERWQASIPAGAERRRAELEARKGRVLDNFEAGHITREARDEKLRALAGLLAGLGGSPAARPEILDTADVVRVVEVLDGWARLAWGDRREVLEALAPTFVVHRYQIAGVSLPVGATSTSSRRNARPAPVWIPLGLAA